MPDATDTVRMNNTHTHPLTELDSLRLDRENASTPGVKAHLTKRINALTDSTDTPSGSDYPCPPVTPEGLATVIRDRKALPRDASPGVKAALTRHAREIAAQLDLPDPFPSTPVTRVEDTPSKAALKRLQKDRDNASTAGVKASLTRKIRLMEAALDNA